MLSSPYYVTMCHYTTWTRYGYFVWEETQYGVAAHNPVEPACCIHRPHSNRRRKINERRWHTSKQKKLKDAFSQIVFSTLQMQVATTSESTVPTYWTTRHHIREHHTPRRQSRALVNTFIIIIIIIIFIYCNWVVTRWQWLCYMYTKHEIG